MEFEQTPGDGGGQGSLAFFSPWGLEESDMTEQPQLDSTVHHFNPFLTLIFPEWRRTPLQSIPWKLIMTCAQTPVNNGHPKAWASQMAWW